MMGSKVKKAISYLNVLTWTRVWIKLHLDFVGGHLKDESS